MDMKDTKPSISGGTTMKISVVNVMIPKRIPYIHGQGYVLFIWDYYAM